MKIKTITAKLIYFKKLSEAIQQELLDSEPRHKETLFWAKSPSSIKQMEEQPNWYEFCREEDIKAGEHVLIEI